MSLTGAMGPVPGSIYDIDGENIEHGELNFKPDREIYFLAKPCSRSVSEEWHLSPMRKLLPCLGHFKPSHFFHWAGISLPTMKLQLATPVAAVSGKIGEFASPWGPRRRDSAPGCTPNPATPSPGQKPTFSTRPHCCPVRAGISVPVALPPPPQSSARNRGNIAWIDSGITTTRPVSRACRNRWSTETSRLIGDPPRPPALQCPIHPPEHNPLSR